MLAVSFILAQGSLFLAQTLLIVGGDLRLVGLFGTSITAASLACYVVDCGGMVALARRELIEEDASDGATFWAFSLFRLLLAIGGVLAIAAFVATAGSSFSTAYAAAAAPSLFFAAVNPSGILDGLRRSGMTGVTTMPPTLASAVALPLAAGLPEILQGIALGTAFTIGSAASLALQYRVLRKCGRSLPYTRTSWARIIDIAKEGVLVLASQLPGQLFYRVQIGIAAALFGPEPTGLVVYAKQLANAGLQAVAFVRRAELPRVIESLRIRPTLRAALRVQAPGLLIATVLSAALFLAGVAGARIDEKFGGAATLIIGFSPAVITGAVYASMNQAFVVRGLFRQSAIAGNMVVAFGCLLSYQCAKHVGVLGVPASEVLMQTFGALVLYALWRRSVDVVDANQVDVSLTRDLKGG